MKCCPVDTFENNRPDADLLRRELFAYPPNIMDSNYLRDFRWWNTMSFFKRVYREGAWDFRFAKNTKRDLKKT
jgi:hypothetical protein